MQATTPHPSAAPPPPIPFERLSARYGMNRQQVYALALMEALALKFNHQPRKVAAGAWELASRSEPGTVRTVMQVGTRLFCDCPAATGDESTNRQPRICSHTAAVHMLLCKQGGIAPPVRPMPPDVLRYDPSPEAQAALALIAYPRKPKAQPAPVPQLSEVPR